MEKLSLGADGRSAAKATNIRNMAQPSALGCLGEPSEIANAALFWRPTTAPMSAG